MWVKKRQEIFLWWSFVSQSKRKKNRCSCRRCCPKCIIFAIDLIDMDLHTQGGCCFLELVILSWKCRLMPCSGDWHTCQHGGFCQKPSLYCLEEHIRASRRPGSPRGLAAAGTPWGGRAGPGSRGLSHRFGPGHRAPPPGKGLGQGWAGTLACWWARLSGGHGWAGQGRAGEGGSWRPALVGNHWGRDWWPRGLKWGPGPWAGWGEALGGPGRAYWFSSGSPPR